MTDSQKDAIDKQFEKLGALAEESPDLPCVLSGRPASLFEVPDYTEREEQQDLEEDWHEIMLSQV